MRSNNRHELERVYQERLELAAKMEAKSKTAEGRLRALEWKAKLTQVLAQLQIQRN